MDQSNDERLKAVIRSKDTELGNKTAWLWVLGVALLICIFGWNSAATSDASDSQSSYSDSSSDMTKDELVERVDELESNLDGYQTALSDANDAIESVNTCASDSFDAFDSGYFDDGISMLGDCQADTVSEPY